jgi:hypothetical protein
MLLIVTVAMATPVMGRVAGSAPVTLVIAATLPLIVLIGMPVPSPIVLRQREISETKDQQQAEHKNSARSHSQLPPFQNLLSKSRR